MDHGQGLHKSHHVFHRCFSCRSWGVDCRKSRWRSHGRCGGYGFGFSVAGHGLILVMGCWWNQWRLLGIDGNKVWSLGFLKRRRRVRDSFYRRETPSRLTELDSRWVKEAVRRSWASLGLAQIRPTYRSAGPGWAPVGPSLRGSTSGVISLRGRMGPPALLAYMALFECKYGIN